MADTADEINDYPGRGVIIEWPAPTRNRTPLAPWRMSIYDYDSGVQINSVAGMSMVLGGERWDTKVVEVDLRMLVDADGQPLRDGLIAMPDENGRARQATFRAYVMEMRVAGDPAIPTPESVARGEHSPNDFRRHHGLVELGEADVTPEQITEWQKYWDAMTGGAELRMDIPIPIPTFADYQHCHSFEIVKLADGTDHVMPCDCGVTYTQRLQLEQDEAVGRLHTWETSKPVDQYGRAIEPVE